MPLEYILTFLCFLLIVFNAYTIRRLYTLREFTLTISLNEEIQSETKHYILRKLSSTASTPTMALSSALAMISQLAEDRASNEPLDNESRALKLQSLLDTYG